MADWVYFSGGCNFPPGIRYSLSNQKQQLRMQEFGNLNPQATAFIFSPTTSLLTEHCSVAFQQDACELATVYWDTLEKKDHSSTHKNGILDTGKTGERINDRLGFTETQRLPLFTTLKQKRNRTQRRHHCLKDKSMHHQEQHVLLHPSSRSSIFYFLAECITHELYHHHARFAHIFIRLQSCLAAHNFTSSHRHYWMPVRSCHCSHRRIIHHLQGWSGSTY